jgi:hypothetical protein
MIAAVDGSFKIALGSLFHAMAAVISPSLSDSKGLLQEWNGHD